MLNPEIPLPLPISPRAEKVLENACTIARKLRHHVVTPTHIALALLNTELGAHRALLAESRFDVRGCERALLLQLAEAPGPVSTTGSSLAYDPASVELLELADQARCEANQLYLGTIHLLRALYRLESPIAHLLEKHGLHWALPLAGPGIGPSRPVPTCHAA